MELEKLAGLFATQEEAAAWFGVSVRTFKTRLTEPDYREIWERGQSKGRISLRRKQMQLADKNATMAIFLGKQELGQKDVIQSEMTGKGGGPVQFIMELAGD